MEHYICIHGHFYQPPRENPWLEEVEREDSASPYHDWNERITAECYAANAASRILNSKKIIIDIVNNYSKISFNFGPTLLSWLEKNSPDTYLRILQADKESIRRFSGHGSAIAQVYNHIILPLANSRDKRTEVLWGIADFEKRFGRKPEGMWLSETAVDYESLEILAESGISFTILSPDQALRTRKRGTSVWSSSGQEGIDTTRPYLCPLKSGATIAVFFYEKSISQDIAFGTLLENGEKFAARMRDFFSNSPSEELLTIASDGETYGHHHRFADMALSYALSLVEKNRYATITNFGEFLEKFPPSYEVEIAEQTSWSCPHGIQRWMNDCGCHTRGTLVSLRSGGKGMVGSQSPVSLTHQRWRRPLRQAMDLVALDLATLFEKHAAGLLRDPWAARDEYISVILERTDIAQATFLSSHALHPLTEEEQRCVLLLLEMQRNALLMYTSCGWFFEEISGIETIQVMRYACRALDLARVLSPGLNTEERFILKLAEAPSNNAELRNGAVIYEKYVLPLRLSPLQIASHACLLSYFLKDPDESDLYTYRISSLDQQRSDGGRYILTSGQFSLQSILTREHHTFSFALADLGDDMLQGQVWYSDTAQDPEITLALHGEHTQADLVALLHRFGEIPGSIPCTIRDLFSDERAAVLQAILTSAYAEITLHFSQIYHSHLHLLKSLKRERISPSEGLTSAASSYLHAELVRSLERSTIDLRYLLSIIDELIAGGYTISRDSLTGPATRRICRSMDEVSRDPYDIRLLEELNQMFEVLFPLSLPYELYECQNRYFSLGAMVSAGGFDDAGLSPEMITHFLEEFKKLGENLGVQIPKNPV